MLESRQGSCKLVKDCLQPQAAVVLNSGTPMGISSSIMELDMLLFKTSARQCKLQ